MPNCHAANMENLHVSGVDKHVHMLSGTYFVSVPTYVRHMKLITLLMNSATSIIR